MEALIEQLTLPRVVFALATSSFLSIRGLRKKSLSIDGAIAAFITGMIHCIAGYDFTLILAVFFLSSSMWTKYKSEIKRDLEEDFKEGGQRNIWQVLCNSATASILCVAYIAYIGLDQQNIDYVRAPLASFLICAFLGHYACCNGDTWASELGILSKGDPILITTLKRVPKGTNGGISALGTFASISGGFVLGVCYWLGAIPFAVGHNAPPQWPVIVLTTLAGLLGSIIDSLLGATLQSSYKVPKARRVVSHPTDGAHITGINLLSNNMVNYISALLTAVICGYAGSYLF